VASLFSFVDVTVAASLRQGTPSFSEKAPQPRQSPPIGAEMPSSFNSAASQKRNFDLGQAFAPSFLMSMTFAQTLGVCREGKSVPTFRIMRQHGFGFHSLACLCDLR
jgi:hypothetical protein